MNLKQSIKVSLQKHMPKDSESIKDINTISSKLKEEEFDEATGSGSAGGYVGPLFGESDKDDDETKKVEATEATGASSAGQYSGPSFLAKSQKKKDWRGKSKPQIPGGKFVKVKKKCLTFPYCNQGDINALKLTELDVFENLIQKLALEYRIDQNILRKLINEEILKNNNN